MRRRRRNTRLERIFMAVVLGLLLAFGASVWWEVSHTSGEEAEPVQAAADTTSGAEPPRVEVLNGAGEPGIAETTAERLRSRGFDVVFFGNAEDFDFEATRVIARSERLPAARRLADVLDVDSVRREPRPDLYLDATVILGADWQVHVPSADGEAGGRGPSAAGGG